MEIDMTALRMVENEKGVSLETLVDAIEEALLKAYHNLPGRSEERREGQECIYRRLPRPLL